jgi:biopolymer transport protein ExbB/TolQ
MISLSIYNWYIIISKSFILRKQALLDRKIEFVSLLKETNIDYLEKKTSNFLDHKQFSLESHLGSLATSASTAPFIGLLGTVWGIAKALKGIGESGSASLSIIAGPIGESLISTAFGLFVAIPAAVFYNILLTKISNIIANDKIFMEMAILDLYSSK